MTMMEWDINSILFGGFIGFIVALVGAVVINLMMDRIDEMVCFRVESTVERQLDRRLGKEGKEGKE